MKVDEGGRRLVRRQAQGPTQVVQKLPCPPRGSLSDVWTNLDLQHY